MGRDGDTTPAGGTAGLPQRATSLKASSARPSPAPTAGASVDRFSRALEVARRAENLAVFAGLEAIAGMYEDWLPDAEQLREDRRRRRRDVSAEATHEAMVVAETAATMVATEGAAGRRVDAAVTLLIADRLPRTTRLARRGVLEWRKIDALVVKTRHLSPEDAARVEALVLVPAVVGLTIGRFENAVDRAVIAVDPAAAEERRKDVVRERRVSLFRNGSGADGTDGGATLWASGPADGLTGAMAALDASARWYRSQGDPRTLDQLRHDLLVTACTTGRLDAPHDLVTTALKQALSSPDGTQPAAAAAGVALGPRPDVTVHLNVTITLQTLLGLNEHPATLAGYGAIPAQMARDLTTDPARDVIWRCVVVDDTHATVLGVGKTTYTRGHTAGVNLATFLDVAAPECEIPWCTAKAEHCDLEHHRPHADGGATCSCNVGRTCRRHHRLKTTDDLPVRPSTDPSHPPGTNIRTTPGGRDIIELPYAPLPPEAYQVARPEPEPDAIPDTSSAAEPAANAADDDPPF